MHNQAAIMLEDEDPGSFSFTDDFFAWREWKIDVERLRYRRKFVSVVRQLQLRRAARRFARSQTSLNHHEGHEDHEGLEDKD